MLMDESIYLRNCAMATRMLKSIGLKLVASPERRVFFLIRPGGANAKKEETHV